MKTILIITLIATSLFSKSIKEESLSDIKETVKVRIDVKRLQLDYLEKCLDSKTKKQLGLCIKQISPNDFRTINLIKE